MQKTEPWQVLKSVITFEDPWLCIRTDTCQTPQGYLIETYHVMECSTWVNVLAFTTEGQLVLVREYRHGAGQVLIGLPGGAVERDESPISAIQRELFEETGYSGGQFFEIGSCYANPASQDNIVYSFLAVDVVPSQEQQLDEAEQIEIVLQDFESFNQQVWSGEIVLQALQLATIGFATHFILNSELPQLNAIRALLLQDYARNL